MDRTPPARLTEAEQLIWHLGFNAGQEAEREACAMIAETYAGNGMDGTYMNEGGNAYLTREDIAAAIRSRNSV